MTAFYDVIKNQTCIGCGYCASLAKGNMNFNSNGFLQPVTKELEELSSADIDKINSSCPGINGSDVVSQTTASSNTDYMWGKYLYVGTAFSTDNKIRFTGSSGGAITGICSWLLETGIVDSVLNTFYSEDNPILTDSKFVKNSSQLLYGAGSKYSPSSPLAILNSIRGKKGSYAIVARPCDISTLRRAISNCNDLDEEKLILIAFFCAGTPSKQGNEKLVKKLGVNDIEDVESFRHRGNGWPGFTKAQLKDGSTRQCTYNESWGGILRNHTNDLCKICPDGIGEQADIVAADAWYGDTDGYPDFDEKEGRSLLIARTEVGLNILKNAIAENAIVATPLNIREIDAMQPGQLNRRKQLRMRILAFKLMGRRVPKFNYQALKQYEIDLSLRDKIRVFLKTLKKLW